MKVLQLQKFFYLRDGASRYFLNLTNLLKNNGIQQAFFSMKDTSNLPSKWEKYFVSNISFSDVNIQSSLKLSLRMFYSFEAKHNLQKLLSVFKPDIAHVHSFYHHLSPSILFELKKNNIPIVHTVGDYHLISSHHDNLFHKDHICEVVKEKKFYNIVRYKCVKNSYIASIAEAIEQYFIDYFGVYKNIIDLFIAPSIFLSQKLQEYGIPEKKIVLLPYFTNYSRDEIKTKSGDYILYFGRLSPEKGLSFLIQVIKLLPKITFKIVGSGLEAYKLINYINKNKLKNVKIITKFVSDEKLKQYILNSKFCIFPSVSYEIFGISLIETFALGKTVLASRIGAFSEIIDNKNGLLFESGNIQDCINKINKLWSNTNLCLELGNNAKKTVINKYNSKKHFIELIKIYSKTIYRSS